MFIRINDDIGIMYTKKVKNGYSTTDFFANIPKGKSIVTTNTIEGTDEEFSSQTFIANKTAAPVESSPKHKTETAASLPTPLERSGQDLLGSSAPERRSMGSLIRKPELFTGGLL